MIALLRTLKSRPLMMCTIILGILVGVLLPSMLRPVTRALWGWNAGVWTYLIGTAVLMLQADHHQLRRRATLHAEGLTAVMAIAIGAAIASLAAITLELSHAKSAAGQPTAWRDVLFALFTIVGSWMLLPTLFTMTYASRYYDDPDGPGDGLTFPSDSGPKELPDYTDFLYFSFTIAVASQTSDVVVTRRQMRHWVTGQSILSFFFNTMLLALGVNIAAGLL